MMSFIFFCSYKKGSVERLKFYQSVTMKLGSACYIEGALSSMLFLALEFHDDYEGGVLANANCGGNILVYNCNTRASFSPYINKKEKPYFDK